MVKDKPPLHSVPSVVSDNANIRDSLEIRPNTSNVIVGTSTSSSLQCEVLRRPGKWLHL